MTDTDTNDTDCAYTAIRYTSADGLTLYARDYRCEAPAGTVLCMHGLTRNSADFEEVCEQLADTYRLIAVDQRGRGRSDYASNPEQYAIETYVNDMFTLLDYLSLEKVILLGTSMGGLISMVMAAMQPQRIQGVILNDVGPEICASGLSRIQSYVGKTKTVSNWQEAAAQAREINEAAFPDYNDAQWLAFAQRTYTEINGVPCPAYDPAIAQPMESNVDAVAPDLWPVFAALTNIPTLVIRGAFSDILAPQCVEKMQREKPDLQYVEIPNRGHAPSLEEPESIAAIRKRLAGIV